MKFKKLITILTVSTMVLGNSVWSYADERPKDLEVKQEYSDMEARMEQERLRIEQEILERIENSPVTLSEAEVNPMGLPDIDPVTNPASDNWLTREVASQVGKDNIAELTQEDFNKITEIDLNNNGLTEIPKEIGNLTNLQSLELGSNQLTEIPKEIGNLSNLQDLLLANNQLTEVPVEIGNLSNLQSLGLHGNQLIELPAEIGNLTNLRYLALLINQLTEVPKEIGNLSNLQFLYLHNNQLTDIPTEIFNLTNLQRLYLSNNQLTELPNELSNLTNLFDLQLNNQNIKLDNKHIVPAKEFTIQNPINLFGNPVVLTNISNAGVYNSSDNTITWLASDSNRDETFEFSQNGTLNGRAYTFSGTATLPTTIEKDEPLSLTLSNGAASQTISTSETLSIPVSLKGTGDYYALDTQIEYDSELLEFKGYSVKKGLKAYYSSNENNTLRYILASQGKDNPINSSVSDIVYLNFTPKQAGITNVKIKAGQVANLDKEIDITTLGTIAVTIEDKPIVVSKDVNRDGKFSLIDLAIDGYYYGMSADETDKTKYDADIIPDGKIDDADLKEIVKLILNSK